MSRVCPARAEGPAAALAPMHLSKEVSSRGVWKCLQQLQAVERADPHSPQCGAERKRSCCVFPGGAVLPARTGKGEHPLEANIRAQLKHLKLSLWLCFWWLGAKPLVGNSPWKPVGNIIIYQNIQFCYSNHLICHLSHIFICHLNWNAACQSLARVVCTRTSDFGRTWAAKSDTSLVCAVPVHFVAIYICVIHVANTAKGKDPFVQVIIFHIQRQLWSMSVNRGVTGCYRRKGNIRILVLMHTCVCKKMNRKKLN